jgi:hypothetical protein
MTAPRPTDTTAHSAHDLTLISSLADRDAAEAFRAEELTAARAQLDGCSECAAAHRDLLDLMAGMRSSAAPSRPRDFRLTPDDAARLQPGGIRGFLRTIGSARDGLTRPLAVGLTTLGLVAVLVGSVPGAMSLGGATSMMAQQDSGAAPSAAAMAPAAGEASAAPDASVMLEFATDELSDAMRSNGYVFNGSEGFAPTPPPMDASVEAAEADEAALRDDPTGRSVIIVLGGTMLILGLGLFALRWTSRRLG